MKAVVLAGCGDERLGLLTESSPIAALPIAGKPLINLLLEYLECHGVSAVVVACCRWPYQMELALAKRAAKMPVSTLLIPPFTGSANILSRVASQWVETFVVVMGDILTNVDLSDAIDFHRRKQAMVTVIVCEADTAGRYGELGVDRDGAVVMVGSESLIWRGKRRTVNSGLYIFEPAAMKLVPSGSNFDLIRDLLPLMVEKDYPVYARRQIGYWRAISSYDQYRLANIDLLSEKVNGFKPSGKEVSQGVWMESNVTVDSAAILKPPFWIGQNCRIEKDAAIGPGAVIGAEVHIKRGAIVAGSVVLERSKVGLATQLENKVVRGNEIVGDGISDCICVDDPQILEPVEPRDLERAIKMVFERAAALVALVLLSPLILLIALLIRLDSPGPIFYTQLRVGEGRKANGGRYSGRVIEVIKFRTMYQDADRRLKDVIGQNEYGSAPFVKIRDDPRITRIGKLLRATSLDELPQLINVLKGEMALVGNRPLPLYEAAMLNDDWQRIRFNAPAGITGLWQISGRSDLSAEERMVLDNYYALTHSFWSDIKILLITIPRLLARRGAR